MFAQTDSSVSTQALVEVDSNSDVDPAMADIQMRVNAKIEALTG